MMAVAWEDPKLRMWRTLVRVHKVYEHCVEVVIPAWCSHILITLNKADIPQPLRDKLKAGYRFHVRVNIGADCPHDFQFADYEDAPGYQNEKA